MAANEALGLGYGGVSIVGRVCGLSRKAITKGIGELQEGVCPPEGLICRAGAGRKKLTETDAGLLSALEDLVDCATRGDPETPLRWVCKSTRTLAAQLTQQRHPISYVKVAQLLHAQNYSLQSNRKTEEGDDHPDLDAQFRHINACVKRSLAAGLPVISVDTKKKELVGDYDNAGQQWLASKQPRQVSGHDFPGPEVPRAFPYGIYDLGRNAGFVNVGTDHDTGAFAVASIRGWWRWEGRAIYPAAQQIPITADGGGSNGSRLRLWKLKLQRLADETGLFLSICHFPPGNQQMEQDRAPSLLVHLFELAGRTVAGFRDDREPHRQDQHCQRPEGKLPVRSPEEYDRAEGHGRGDEAGERQAQRSSWRLELRDQASCPNLSCNLYLLPQP